MIQIPVVPAISDYLHNKASRERIPLNGTFELTPVCNMSCKMCYVRMTRQQQEAISPLRSAKEWLELAERAKNEGLLYLLLTGGEPFLHPEFREILTGLHQLGLLISINTNATLIDEETVEWLKTVPPTRMNITLYGASDQTYARLCGNPKGYTQVTRAIRMLREAGISVKLNCSITPYNAEDLEQIIAFAKREMIPVQASSYMFPPLRRDPSQIGQNDRFTPRDAAYYSAKVEALLGGEEAFLSKPDNELSTMSCDADENCEGVGETIRCRAGKCCFWVTWDGKMMPCGMLPSQKERNIFDGDFVKVWREVVSASDQIRLPAKCASCELKDTCKACAAMVMTESGCYDKVPEYRCQMAHAFPEERKRLKNEILAARQGAAIPDLEER